MVELKEKNSDFIKNDKRTDVTLQVACVRVTGRGNGECFMARE